MTYMLANDAQCDSCCTEYFIYEYNSITKLSLKLIYYLGSICSFNSQRTINSMLSFTVNCSSKIYFTTH